MVAHSKANQITLWNCISGVFSNNTILEIVKWEKKTQWVKTRSTYSTQLRQSECEKKRKNCLLFVRLDGFPRAFSLCSDLYARFISVGKLKNQSLRWIVVLSMRDFASFSNTQDHTPQQNENILERRKSVDDFCVVLLFCRSVVILSDDFFC